MRDHTSIGFCFCHRLLLFVGTLQIAQMTKFISASLQLGTLFGDQLLHQIAIIVPVPEVFRLPRHYTRVLASSLTIMVVSCTDDAGFWPSSTDNTGGKLNPQYQPCERVRG